MKKYIFYLLFLFTLSLIGCTKKADKEEEIIKQLENNEGTVTLVTDTQIDTVNEVIESYYPDAVYPYGHKKSDYTVTYIEDTYRIKGVFSNNNRNEYVMIIKQNEDNNPYTLISFYVNGERIDEP